MVNPCTHLLWISIQNPVCRSPKPSSAKSPTRPRLIWHSLIYPVGADTGCLHQTHCLVSFYSALYPMCLVPYHHALSACFRDLPFPSLAPYLVSCQLCPSFSAFQCTNGPLLKSILGTLLPACPTTFPAINRNAPSSCQHVTAAA